MRYLGAGLLLLCQAQDSGQHTWFHGNRNDAGEVLLGKIALSISWGHLEKKIAAKVLKYLCRVVPADAVRNVICQITSAQSVSDETFI
jgi:hypothetical protein